MATHFLLLAQKKVSKEKCTRISRCSSLDCHFLYGNFRTRYAQTDENCLKMASRSGVLYGIPFYLSVAKVRSDFFMFLTEYLPQKMTALYRDNAPKIPLFSKEGVKEGLEEIWQRLKVTCA